MSVQPCPEPECNTASGHVDLVVAGRPKDLGGFQVRRVLPSPRRRLVGPFIFFDHAGPAHFPPGQGIDVRPHPHVGLATVTYLFEGDLFHKDSLGFEQQILPGAVNWMTAGRGIVHSERTAPESRARESALHGIQSWVALPQQHEEVEPSFVHHPADTLPKLAPVDGVGLTLIAGSAYGACAPVKVLMDTFYLDGLMEAGSRLPMPHEFEERAVYVVHGRARIGAQVVEAEHMAILKPGPQVVLEAEEDTRVMLLGGEKMPEPRHIYWNFVSSDPARIERAKADWREGRFAMVPGEDEFIPLPDD